MPLCGGSKSDAKEWWPLSSQNVYVLATTSLASKYLPKGLVTQLAKPILVSSGMELVGEAVAGGEGGEVADDVDVDDSYCIVDMKFDRTFIFISNSAIFTLALFKFFNFNQILMKSRYLFII